MKQCGVVIETGAQTARVRMQRHTSCAGCNACKMGSSEKPIEMEALNPQNVVKGQMVEVEMEHQHVLLAAFLMYVVPLLFLVTGVVMGHYGLQAIGVKQYADLLTALIAFSMTALSYVALNRSERNQQLKLKMLPVITNVIREADSAESN